MPYPKYLTDLLINYTKQKTPAANVNPEDVSALNKILMMGLEANEPHFIEALTLRLSNQLDISMFGKKLNDSFPYISPKADGEVRRLEGHFHPYLKQGTSASATIFQTDPATGELYVYLPKLRRSHLIYGVPGGFVQGHWPDGGEVKVDTRTGDARDRDEEALVGNVNAVAVKQEQQAIKHANYTIEQVGPAIQAIFADLLKTNVHFDFEIDGDVIRQRLHDDYNIDLENDYNATDTAYRETLEEAGIDFRTMGVKPVHYFAQDDFGITCNPKLHVVTNHYLFHVTDRPLLTLTPGSDVLAYDRVAVRDITLADNGIDVQVNGTLIRRDFGTMVLTKAIKAMQNLEIQARSNNCFQTVDNVLAQLNLQLPQGTTAADVLGERPLHPFDSDGTDYFQKIVKLTDQLVQRMAALPKLDVSTITPPPPHHKMIL